MADINIETGNKVLVLITPQFNAHRLIDEGRKISNEINGSLHILYIKKGGNIFSEWNTVEILQDIFMYASKKGGIVHARCSENIKEEMIDFIINENVTKVIFGQSPITKRLTKKDIASEIKHQLDIKSCNAEVIVVEKEEMDVYKAI